MSEGNGNTVEGFPLSEKEQREIVVEESAIQELCNKGSLCLVGRLGVRKKLNKEAFKTVLQRIWRPSGRLVVKEIRADLWLFEFSEDRDKQKVLAGRPWSYDRTLLILNEFDGKISPSQMDFSSSPIWVQVHDMPLGCMNRGVGSQIESSLGEVEEVPVAEDDVGWGRYLRIRVAINLFQPLERGRTLWISGKPYWVPFKYEKLPIFCFRCGRIIHGQKGCTDSAIRKNRLDGSEGWGPWLRAEELLSGPGRQEDMKVAPACSDHGWGEEEVAEDYPGKEEKKRLENQEVSFVHGAVPNAETSEVCGLGVAGSPKGGKVEESKVSKKRKSRSIPGRSAAPFLGKYVDQGLSKPEDFSKKGRVSKESSSNASDGPNRALLSAGPSLKSKSVEWSEGPTQYQSLNQELRLADSAENPMPPQNREAKQSGHSHGSVPADPGDRTEEGSRLKEWKRLARGSPLAPKGEASLLSQETVANPAAFERYGSLADGRGSDLAVAGLQPRQSP